LTRQRLDDTFEARPPAAWRRAASGYDGSEDDAESVDDLADSIALPAAESPAALVDSPACVEVDVTGFDVGRASFFAQPEPLYTTAAAETALRNWPPQIVQVVGPGAWTPWMTSTMWPQLRQT
jgi:hypothetical protein